MYETSEKIFDFYPVQVSDVSSSNAMENEGCKSQSTKLLIKT